MSDSRSPDRQDISKLTDEDLRKALEECETRLAELKNSTGSAKVRSDLDAVDDILRSCRSEIDAAKDTNEKTWLDVKHSIMTRLDDAQRNLQLTKRRMIDVL